MSVLPECILRAASVHAAFCAVAVSAVAASVAPGSYLAAMYDVHGIGYFGILYGYQASRGLMRWEWQLSWLKHKFP